MNKYLLLRNNEQRGPYSLEELKNLSLHTRDLIWIVGKSEGWTYAGEIEELIPYANENAEEPVSYSSASAAMSEPVLETKYARPLDEIKELYVHHLQKKDKTKTYRTALISSIVALLVLGGLFVMKNTSTSKPKEVQVKVAPVTPQTTEPITNSQNFQNALSKEFVPYEAKPPKKAKPKNLKKLVAVEMNDYHVKLFGGINDLQLNVHNYSDHLLDKIVIQVDYFKPKGEIVNTETVTIKNIKPQDSKIIDVPPSKRGVKAKAIVLDVESQEYKGVVEEI